MKSELIKGFRKVASSKLIYKKPVAKNQQQKYDMDKEIPFRMPTEKCVFILVFITTIKDCEPKEKADYSVIREKD